MEPIKVLIVDDEYLIRNLLKKRINWEEHDMRIVGEASNAHEALDMVDELRPDIIFTDICMPSLDGIEFSRIVIEKYPEIKIVIVTGHDEFEFARKSIKLGISDFILKPIRAAEILSITDRLKNKISEERSRNKEFEKLKEELKKNFPYLKEKFLNRWIQQPLEKDEIIEKIKYFSIPLDENLESYQLAVLEISFPQFQQTEDYLLLLGMECRKRVEEYFRDNKNIVIFADNKNQIVILGDNNRSDFVNSLELLKTNIINTYKCFVCIGIGNKHKDLKDVYVGYREACQALNFKTLVGKNQVVCYDDVVESAEQPYHSNTELLEKLHFFISAGFPENAVLTLRDILNVPLLQLSQLRLAAIDIIAKCQLAIVEQKIDDVYSIDRKEINQILMSDNLPEMQKHLENYITALASFIKSKNETKTTNLIRQVKDFLEENMSNPELSLANTASRFFVSSGHLGRLMKKETGETFVEYLTKIRLKKAELLLKSTDLKGYQIGEMVGITDPHYFSILFKKNIGVSLSEFRCGSNEQN